MQGATLSTWIEVGKHDLKAIRASTTAALREPSLSLKSSWARTRSEQQSGQLFVCVTCAASFDTRQKVATHAFKAHGTKNAARSYVDTTHCPMCMQDFSTRGRVIRHLEDKSQRCLSALLISSVALSKEAQDAQEAESRSCIRGLSAQGLRPSHARKPVFRLVGPLTCVATAAGICHKNLLPRGV